MRDGFFSARVVSLATRASRWRHRRRALWLIGLALVIAICASAIAAPAKRSQLLCGAIGLVAVGCDVAWRRRQRRERAALVARAAAASGDEIPADVIELIAADKKIRAIKRYRDLSGVGLREAKAVIDSVAPR